MSGLETQVADAMLTVVIYKRPVRLSGGREIAVYEFTEDVALKSRACATVLAPAGSAFRDMAGRVRMLKVPKVAGNPHDYHLLTAREALESARSGAYGLGLTDVR